MQISFRIILFRFLKLVVVLQRSLLDLLDSRLLERSRRLGNSEAMVEASFLFNYEKILLKL